MSSKKYLLLPLIWLVALTGCTKEDTSNCPDNTETKVILKYTYSMNMEYKDLFGDKVGNLNAYFFNEQGILCDSLIPEVTKSKLQNGWQKEVKLDPGKYTIVTWAGDDGFRRSFQLAHTNETESSDFAKGITIGTTTLEDMRIFLDYTRSQEADEAYPKTAEFNDLFHGIAKNIDVKKGKTTIVATPLIKNTNTINVKVTGINAIDINSTPEAGDFKLSLKGRNGHYRYDNLIGEYSPLVSYEPQNITLANNQLSTTFKTLRLMTAAGGDAFHNSPLKLAVYYDKTSKYLVDMDIVELIMESKIDKRDPQGNIVTDDSGNPVKVLPDSEYLDRQDVYDIELVAERDPNNKLTFTVKVNGWTITNIYPEV